MTDELPNKTVLFRHALRLFPIAFRESVADDYPIFKLHLCRTLISTSVALRSPPSTQNHEALIGFEDLLNESSLESLDEIPVLSDPIWARGLNGRQMTWMEAGPLSSATRALTSALRVTPDNPLILSLQDESEFFGTHNELAYDLIVTESSLLHEPLWPSIPRKKTSAEPVFKVGVRMASSEQTDQWSFWRE